MPMRTPAQVLRSAIQKLPLETPIAGRWRPPSHYPSHQAHWIGWLQEYDGPGYYNRKVPKKPRSMPYIYAHIHCAPMLLWLAEAAGVRTSQLRKADGALRRLVRDGLHDSNPACGRAVRSIIPWREIEAALIEAGLLGDATKSYRLLGADRRFYSSTSKGQLGGNGRLKIYGRLDCPSALSAIRRGQTYQRHRVFFADEATAIAAGFRPCGKCMRQAYNQWKVRGKCR
jgi:hypothetical protein